MPMFCRHNRLTARCPICSREQEAELRAQLPGRAPRTRSGPSPASRRAAASPRGGGAVRTRRMERAPDDGYRNPLVPGLRATADARRLAGALVAAAARLEFPGPYPQVAEAGDPERAAWLAFLLVASDGDPAVAAALAEAPPRLEEGLPSVLPEAAARLAEGYAAWVGRHGSQAAAFTGDPGWTPTQRFGRVFERLAIPGFRRAGRYELLNVLAAARVFALEADALHPGDDEDPATVAAKRVLLSGDRMLIERRARALAQECEVPLAALDRALADWERGGGDGGEPPPAVARALRI